MMAQPREQHEPMRGDKATVTFVMGTGRCGSTAVANVLQAAGMPMGQKQISGEDSEFHKLNRALAQQLNWGWEMIPAMKRDLERMKPLNKADASQKYREWLDGRSKQSLHWGAKCPAFALVYSELQHLLPRHQLLIVDRRADAVIDSMAEKEGISHHEASILYQWMIMRNHQALHDAWWAGVEVIRVQYEALMERPKIAVATMLQQVGDFHGVHLDYFMGMKAIRARSTTEYMRGLM